MPMYVVVMTLALADVVAAASFIVAPLLAKVFAIETEVEVSRIEAEVEMSGEPSSWAA